MKTMKVGTMFVILVVALMFSSTKEEQLSLNLPGTCPDYPGVPLKGISEKTVGHWYGLFFLNNGYEDDVHCFTAIAVPKSDYAGKLVTTVIKTGETEIIQYSSIDGQSARFALKKDGVDASGFNNIRSTSSLVLADSKLVVEVVCTTNGINHQYKAIVYYRLPKIDAASLTRAKAVLKAVNINDELEDAEDCDNN